MLLLPYAKENRPTAYINSADLIFSWGEELVPNEKVQQLMPWTYCKDYLIDATYMAYRQRPQKEYQISWSLRDSVFDHAFNDPFSWLLLVSASLKARRPMIEKTLEYAFNWFDEHPNLKSLKPEIFTLDNTEGWALKFDRKVLYHSSIVSLICLMLRANMGGECSLTSWGNAHDHDRYQLEEISQVYINDLIHNLDEYGKEKYFSYIWPPGKRYVDIHSSRGIVAGSRVYRKTGSLFFNEDNK